MLENEKESAGNNPQPNQTEAEKPEAAETLVKSENFEKQENRGSIQAEIAPIKAELEKLRELKREIIFEKVKLMHPELDLEQAKEGLKELEERLNSSYAENGMAKQRAAELAKQTLTLWENEEGIAALSIVKKLRSGEINFSAKPDFHITPSAPTPQAKSWKDKLKSEDAKERLSVFDELFRS
jgi:hypothetical protein